MNKISLDIKKVFRTIEVNGKRIKIPKLGLKHHAIITQSNDMTEAMKQILQSICKNMSVSEKDFVMLHLLAYNGKIKEKTTIDGHEYSIFDVKLSQQLKFWIGDTEYRFRTPTELETKPTIDQVLTSNCVSVKKDGVSQPIPDFLEMPAFVHDWVYKICDSISLSTEHGDIKGLYNLIGTFDGD